ncbi:MAG: ABC transporter permease [Microthrixaceae bacterium]
MSSLLPRLGRLVVVLFLVTMFAALLVSFLPGDPVRVVAPFASEQQRDEIAADLGVDDPLPVRYVNWLGDFVSGDLGKTYSGPTSSTEVSSQVADALPVSLTLMVYAQIIALVLAIPLGVIAAYRAGGWLDRIISSSSFAFLALPAFVLGFLLSYYLRLKLGLFRVKGGYTPVWEDPVNNIKFLALPALALALGQVAVYARLLRSDMIATLQQDFITMARAKGLSTKRILWRHALRPSSITLLTAAGLNIGTLIGGALVIEVVFQVPGMGLLAGQAMGGRQLVAVQSIVAIFALIYVAVNVFVDMAYTVVDPRIRRG